MKQSIVKSMLKLKSVYQALAVLVKNDPIQYPYRVVSISMDDNENYLATVQLVGKGQAFQIKPEEILSNDDMTMSFSQKDIRMLTYLGYLSVHSPKYKILAQRLSEKDNKIIFAVKKRGEKTPIIKTAAEISVDHNFIEGLNQHDAHMIGYTAATEQLFDDQEQIQQLKNVKNSSDKSNSEKKSF